MILCRLRRRDRPTRVSPQPLSRLLSIFTGGHRKLQPPYFHSVHDLRARPVEPVRDIGAGGAVSAKERDRGVAMSTAVSHTPDASARQPSTWWLFLLQGI